MKRLLLTLLLAALAVSPLAAGQGWPLERINKSLGRMTGEKEGGCTAFSINRDKGLWLTALHCNVLGTVRIEDIATQVIAEYPDYDLAVYGGAHRPALSLGPKPKLGDEVLSVGYAYGAPFLTAIPAIVLDPNTTAPDEMFNYQWQYPNHIRGMSGGPVVNRAGQVVGLVDCAYESLGCSIMYESVAMVVRKYR